MEAIFDLWAKRNPEWEVRYQKPIIELFCNYGKGVDQYQDIRGKIYGAGYEIFIIAFFIGVYHGKTKPLNVDKSKRKNFGQPIMYWGSIENRVGRQAYPRIKEYMYAALIARTDIDWISVDKGEMTSRAVVDKLIEKMEQYANFGFDYISEKLEDDPNYFFKDTAFLRIFTSLLSNKNDEPFIDESPDALDDDNSINSSDADESDIQIKLEEAALRSAKKREEESRRWYSDEVDFEIMFYRRDYEYWHIVHLDIQNKGILSPNDTDFIENMSILLSKNRQPSENQMRKMYHTVEYLIRKGYKFPPFEGEE